MYFVNINNKMFPLMNHWGGGGEGYMNVRSDYYRQKLHSPLTRITKERVLLFTQSTFENKEEFVLDFVHVAEFASTPRD